MRRRRDKLTKREKEIIIERYKKGDRIKEITKDLVISHTSLYRIVNDKVTKRKTNGTSTITGGGSSTDVSVSNGEDVDSFIKSIIKEISDE